MIYLLTYIANIANIQVRKSTTIGRVKEAYVSKRGIDYQSVKFFLDDRELNDSSTAASAELEENDIIEVIVGSQTSAASKANVKLESAKSDILNEMEEYLNRNTTESSQIKVRPL